MEASTLLMKMWKFIDVYNAMTLEQQIFLGLLHTSTSWIEDVASCYVGRSGARMFQLEDLLRTLPWGQSSIGVRGQREPSSAAPVACC
jgi:hypothetical protein